jgi:hypothetical protein
LSPRAVECLGELLDSADERVRLEAARTILDRHLGRPAIQAAISLHRADADGPLEAMLEGRALTGVGTNPAGGRGGRGDYDRAVGAFALTPERRRGLEL